MLNILENISFPLKYETGKYNEKELESRKLHFTKIGIIFLPAGETMLLIMKTILIMFASVPFSWKKNI